MNNKTEILIKEEMDLIILIFLIIILISILFKTIEKLSPCR